MKGVSEALSTWKDGAHKWQLHWSEVWGRGRVKPVLSPKSLSLKQGHWATPYSVTPPPPLQHTRHRCVLILECTYNLAVVCALKDKADLGLSGVMKKMAKVPIATQCLL